MDVARTAAATAAGAALAYLLGSISTGLLLARARGVDLRSTGSGNIGATNVARALGRRAAVAVFAGDALKGLLPPLAARLALRGRPEASTVASVAAVAALCGHLWPIWHRLRGGKGVATGAGAFLALSPLAVALAGAAWALVFLPTRIASAASLTAAATLISALALLGAPAPVFAAAAVGVALVVWRHRGNIGRLLRREESPLGPT